MTDASLTSRLGARVLRTRWIVRAPILLYRAGLGFVFGSRLLMLQHTGRRSGAPRFVVLEIVDNPAPGEYVIVSGFGVTAQWYRNIQADPRVRLWTGFRRGVPATATPMSDPESATALNHYVQQHPQAWDKLRGTIEQATGKPVDTLPMVALHIDTPR
ncbi:nitroreductase family deazaflavin-dependent oxidoreductase [Nocardia alni]|uniref:nitroreductase family deazaflavin-dependent oxidoreductase n=1 Tax=Nocardia alni TaxID=2815723 RepID=UPI001C245708|nr:nitroreductase family deazaflavin-dependent oxidoreductase [Nocardia alni]